MEKLIKILSFKLARIKYEKYLSDDFKIMYFLYQGILSDLSKIIVAILISIILKTFIELLIIIIIFGSLRFLSGGYHAKTFNGCFIITIGIYTISPLLSKYISENFKINNIVVILFVAAITATTLIYSPKFLLNIDNKKKMKYKLLSVLFVVCLYSLCFGKGVVEWILSILEIKKVRVAILLGVIVQTLTITPIMYKVSDYISRKSTKGE